MTNFSTIENLFDRAERWDKLTPGQQAGLRATLTRQINTVEDNEIKAALLALQDHIGPAETKQAQKLTADDLIAKYPKEYRGMSVRQRGAFKAQISRLLNEATESGDDETVNKLAALTEKMEADTKRLQKERIMARLEQLKK